MVGVHQECVVEHHGAVQHDGRDDVDDEERQRRLGNAQRRAGHRAGADEPYEEFLLVARQVGQASQDGHEQRQQQGCDRFRVAPGNHDRRSLFGQGPKYTGMSAVDNMTNAEFPTSYRTQLRSCLVILMRAMANAASRASPRPRGAQTSRTRTNADSPKSGMRLSAHMPSRKRPAFPGGRLAVPTAAREPLRNRRFSSVRSFHHNYGARVNKLLLIVYDMPKRHE